ncbi:hypothetical protein BDFB_010543, partial [Asbolus verrucosus]
MGSVDRKKGCGGPKKRTDQAVQQLREADYPVHVEYCWFLCTLRTLTAAKYRDILQQVFEELHDDEIVERYYQQDGATAYTTHETLNLI